MKTFKIHASALILDFGHFLFEFGSFIPKPLKYLCIVQKQELKKTIQMKKLKSTFIVWIAIYPAITGILLLFGEYLNHLPLLIRTLILTLVLVPLMVYFLIPFWTKVFSKVK